YQILRALPSIGAYHEFLSLYSGHVITELAQHELFALLTARGGAGDFAEFIARYPSSTLTPLAEIHLHALSFKAVVALGTIDGYDAFLLAFPNAVQVPTVVKLATDLAIAQAMVARQANDAQTAEQQATQLITTTWYDAFTSFIQKWGL